MQIRFARGVEIRVTFFIAKKVTMVRLAALYQRLQLTNQSLVTQKTRLIIRAFAYCPVLFSRLFVFQFPISYRWRIPDRVLFLPEIGIWVAQTILGHRWFAYSRWFFKCVFSCMSERDGLHLVEKFPQIAIQNRLVGAKVRLCSLQALTRAKEIDKDFIKSPFQGVGG